MNLKRRTVVLLEVMLVSLLLGATLLFVIMDYREKKIEDERLDAYMAESYEYRLARQNLTTEYENIEKYTLNRLADGSFMGIVYRSADIQLYTSAFPQMRDREHPIVGMICLRKGALPGSKGAITREQFDEIMSAGWDTALFFEGEGELEDFLIDMRQVLGDAGFEMPKTVLFKKNTYLSSYDSLLYTYGIENAMHHGDDKHLIIEGEVDGKIWHPGALAWNTKGFSASMLAELAKVGGVAYFEVDFNTDSYQLLYDANKEDRTAAFGRMLSVIESYIIKDKLESVSISKAKEGRLEYLSAKETLLEEVAIRKQEILDEIKVIDVKISEIYKKHHNE